MQPQPSYGELLEASRRINWRVDDLVGAGKAFDFSRPFLPEIYARTRALAFLTPAERLTLNHIRARCYLALFELVEQFVVPFISDQAAESEGQAADRGPALRQFVREETKHRELFRRALADFDEAFDSECGVIGPAEDIVRAILGHGELAVAIATLGLEWMSQAHYLDAIRDDQDLDPQFKNLLEHHWMEEAQHARLDELMLAEMARAASADEIRRGVEGYLEIVAFFDGGFRGQAELDLDAFERAARRRLTDAQRTDFLEGQHQALRWTFLGVAMRHPSLLEALDGLGPDARARVERAAAALA